MCYQKSFNSRTIQHHSGDPLMATVPAPSSGPLRQQWIHGAVVAVAAAVVGAVVVVVVAVVGGLLMIFSY